MRVFNLTEVLCPHDGKDGVWGGMREISLMRKCQKRNSVISYSAFEVSLLFSSFFLRGSSCGFVFLPTPLICSKTSVCSLLKWVTCSRVGQLQEASCQLNCTCRVKRRERPVMAPLRTKFFTCLSNKMP